MEFNFWDYLKSKGYNEKSNSELAKSFDSFLVAFDFKKKHYNEIAIKGSIESVCPLPKTEKQAEIVLFEIDKKHKEWQSK